MKTTTYMTLAIFLVSILTLGASPFVFDYSFEFGLLTGFVGFVGSYISACVLLFFLITGKDF